MRPGKKKCNSNSRRDHCPATLFLPFSIRHDCGWGARRAPEIHRRHRKGVWRRIVFSISTHRVGSDDGCQGPKIRNEVRRRIEGSADSAFRRGTQLSHRSGPGCQYVPGRRLREQGIEVTVCSALNETWYIKGDGLFTSYIASGAELLELKSANKLNIRGIKSLG